MLTLHQPVDSKAMLETRKNIKVFLGSPGDLGDERKAAKAVVDECNALYSKHLGYQIELIGWEDTVSVWGRPQATINRELERCQLFIGMMWRHWGTPPALSGPYTSGFEEEFRESVARRQRDGTPEISMFFKAIDADLKRDAGPALEKVLAFRQELIDGKEILFEEFADAADFELKLRRCLTAYLFQLKAEDDAALQTQEAAVEPPPTMPAIAQAGEGPLAVEGAAFLRALADDHQQGDQTSIAPADVARLRLIADMVRTPMNDGEPTGAHDLNLLFAEKAGFTFGAREIRQLATEGLEHYPSENVPLWHWCIQEEKSIAQILLFHAIVGRPQRRIGALRAMTVLGVTDLAPMEVRRETFITSWLAPDASSNLRREALRYLERWGVVADIPMIAPEIDRRDSQTTNAAFETIVRIQLRESREAALRTLNELQPSFVPQRLVGEIFENDHALSAEVLVAGLIHTCADVRRAAAFALTRRSEFPLTLAHSFTSDSDAGVLHEGGEVRF